MSKTENYKNRKGVESAAKNSLITSPPLSRVQRSNKRGAGKGTYTRKISPQVSQSAMNPPTISSKMKLPVI
jgi:hypothetical protein